MDDGLMFYTHPMSRGRVVRWMLEEVGRPYRAELLDYGGSMKSAAYRAINPMGKVPAIRHRGVVVTEVAAICAYLADAFPEAGLAPPPGDPARGPYLRWLFFGAGPVEAAVTNAALGFVLPENGSRMAGYGSMPDVLDAVEGAVEAALAGSGHLAGGGFTAADLYLGSQLGWGMQFGSVEKRPAFERYWERLSARPAARRAVAIDDALLPPESHAPHAG